jgi:hypothetical protein
VINGKVSALSRLQIADNLPLITELRVIKGEVPAVRRLWERVARR